MAKIKSVKTFCLSRIRDYILGKQYEDDFEEEEPAPLIEEKRQIIGLKADEIRENGRTISVDVKEQEEREKQEEEAATLPQGRKVCTLYIFAGTKVCGFAAFKIFRGIKVRSL